MTTEAQSTAAAFRADRLRAPVVPPEPVVIRPARPDELPIVRKQWLNDYAHSTFARLFDSEALFRERWAPVVDTLLRRGKTLMLCPADCADALFYGWIHFEEHTVHYLLVRGKSRRLGYARRLLAEAAGDARQVVVTHPTREAQIIARRWSEETACATGKCPTCGGDVIVMHRRSTSGESMPSWECHRPGRPGRPPCNIVIQRPADSVAAERVRIVFDPTGV